jgi:hypothetical protein
MNLNERRGLFDKLDAETQDRARKRLGKQRAKESAEEKKVKGYSQTRPEL